VKSSGRIAPGNQSISTVGGADVGDPKTMKSAMTSATPHER
jgi:hypothetical protein